MKKMIVLAAGLALLVPSLAFADIFSVKYGHYMPRAVTNSYLTQPQHLDNSLWGIEFDQMSFAAEDFRGGILGFSYERFLGPNLSFVLGVESFSRRKLGDYRDYDQTEFEEGWFAFPIDQEPEDISDWYYISHSFRVSSTPVTASVKFTPLGRKTKLVPYVGGGVGVYFWSTGIVRDWINFNPVDEFGDPIEYFYTDPVYGDITVWPVEPANSRERGMAVGYHAFAGLQFPIGYRATIDAEARYHWAKGKFNDGYLLDFEPFELGGLAVSIGFSYWF
jgi:opacity protein-like surface antigen